MFKKIFFFLFACVAALQASEKVDILFVLQDAGETQALLPVIDLVEKSQKKYIILAGGVAEEQLAGRPHIVHFPDLGVNEKIDKTWKRDQKISAESLTQITAAFDPQKVVSGVAFELHGQILQAFADAGSKTIAYWDNINSAGTDPYFQTAQKVASIAQTVLAPSENFKTYFPHAKALGQPTFEKWQENLASIDTVDVRSKLPFLHSGKTILFIGGYGKEYEEAFELFLVAAKNLKECNILVSFHPKMGGVFEREKIAAETHIHLLTEISTIQAVAIADHVVCHQSTVGVQAAAAGKSVFYLIPPSQTYTNPVIEKGLAPRLQSSEALISVLNEQLPPHPSDFYEALQLPRHSAQLIFQELGHN